MSDGRGDEEWGDPDDESIGPPGCWKRRTGDDGEVEVTECRRSSPAQLPLCIDLASLGEVGQVPSLPLRTGLYRSLDI